MKKNSKQLDSILSSHMYATPINVMEESKKATALQSEERDVRLTAVVPESVKRQFKQKMADQPGETERSIILRALKSYGFDIDERQIKDKRNRNDY